MAQKAQPAAPKGGRIIDLDAARKARAEAQGDPITVVFGGEEFTLPAEMPIDFAEYATEGDIRAALTTLLRDQADAFFAHGLTVQDLAEIMEHISSEYGVEQGKPAAS